MGDWDSNNKDIKSVEKGGSGGGNNILPPLPSNSNITPPSGEGKIEFDDEKIKCWLFDDMEKSSSNICCALYGFDGTAKSGIALDCRTEKEKKEGYKLIVFDLDGGCAPLKVIYHDNDKNIIIKNPLVRNEQKNVDYEATFSKLKSALDYIERNLSKLKIKAIIFDGLDKFLRICEYSMRDVIGKSVEEGIDRRYWKIRNKKYIDILEQIISMDVDRYFITHLKKEHNTSELIPDWEKKTPDIMFQIVRCFREQKVVDGNKIVWFKAEIEKSKTNVTFEGKVFTIAEIKQNPDGKVEAAWNSLIFNKDNTITQKNGRT